MKNKTLYFIILFLLIIISFLIFYIFNNNKNNNEIKSNEKIEKTQKIEKDSIKHENEEFFDKYLSPFQFCNGTLLIDKENYYNDYNIFVGMYYISNYMDRNESTYKKIISSNDINNLIYKYFGTKNNNILEYNKDIGFKITKLDDDNYEIYWGAHDCGYSEYKINEVSYSDNTVTVIYYRYTPDLNTGNIIKDGKKTFTLKYEDNNYHIKKIEYEKLNN